MNTSINSANLKERKRVAKMIREDYENKGQTYAFDMVNAFNKNHVLMIPYEHCNACECESPAIDNECLICGQTTQRMSNDSLFIRGMKACGYKNKHEWNKKATPIDKARVEGYILGAKFGLAAKF